MVHRTGKIVPEKCPRLPSEPLGAVWKTSSWEGLNLARFVSEWSFSFAGVFILVSGPRG